MWESGGKTDISYMKDSCYSEDSDGRHPLFIAFDLLVVIGFFISLLVIIYVNEGKSTPIQRPGVTGLKTVSSHLSNKRKIKLMTAESGKYVRVALKRRAKSKKLFGQDHRKLKSLGLNRKIEGPTGPSAHTFSPLTGSPDRAHHCEKYVSAAPDGSPASVNNAALSHPNRAEESDPSTFIIDFYEPIDIDKTPDTTSVAESKALSLVDAAEPSKEPQAEALNAGGVPSHSTETDFYNENAPAPSTEPVSGVDNHRFSIVDGMVDPFVSSADSLTGRRRQSSAFSRFPDLELNHESGIATGKRPAGRAPLGSSPASTPSTGFPPLSEEEIESSNDTTDRRMVSPSTLNGPSTATATVNSTRSPQDKKPLGMSIVVPKAEEPNIENQGPPVTPSENTNEPRRQSRILKHLGYSDGKPKIAKTPWTPGGSERLRQDGSLPATPQTPFQRGDRKASLVNSESLTSSPISPEVMSRLSWTTSRMRSQTRDQLKSLHSAQDKRSAELFRHLGRRPSLLFPIRENPPTSLRTAPSTPQKPDQSSAMKDVESSPSSPSPAPRVIKRPATAGGPPPSFSTLGRGQVPAYWEPYWPPKGEPRNKEEDGE